MLTNAQIEEAMRCLNLPVRTDVTFQFAGDRTLLRNAEVARHALGNLDSDQEASVIDILSQYTPIKYDTDVINADGLSSAAARTRAHLKKLMADTIGFTFQGGGGSGFRIGRA